MQIIKPIEYLEIPKGTYPIFLAGPIAGAGGWQEVATKYIEEKTKDIQSQIVIIDPSRYIINGKSEKKYTPGYEYKFSRQREWERFYLDNTANNGGTILFWLPTQKEIIPNNPDGTQKKSYASTTRQEIGTAMIRYPNSVLVGINKNFPERSIIEDDFRFYTGNPDLRIYSSLEEVLEILISKII